MRKYAIELVAALVFLCLIGGIAFHCTHKTTAGGMSLAADATTSATDWVLVWQVAGTVIVALIGAAPSLYRTYKSGGLQAAIAEVEKDAEVIVDKASPLLSPAQLAEAKALIAKGETFVDAYEAVKTPPNAPAGVPKS